LIAKEPLIRLFFCAFEDEKIRSHAEKKLEMDIGLGMNSGMNIEMDRRNRFSAKISWIQLRRSESGCGIVFVQIIQIILFIPKCKSIRKGTGFQLLILKENGCRKFPFSKIRQYRMK